MNVADDAVVRVGGARMTGAQARADVTDYLTRTGVWSYPTYDGYSGGGTHLLNEMDLLSPVLSVSQRYLQKYYVLTGLIDELNPALRQIPVAADLAQATDPDLDKIAELFGILDHRRTPGVRLTTLSKVLHRKRPNFIPLYDERIRRCYQVLGDSPPVPSKRGRSWADFTRAWIPVLQGDLAEQWATWTDLASLAPGPPITPLRALDIVGWHLGQIEEGAAHAG